MKLGSKTKGPDDILPFDFEFDQWLEAADRITEATASVENGSVVVDDVIPAERQVRVWLSGGAIGESCVVRLKVTTLAQMTKEFCLHMRIQRC